MINHTKSVALAALLIVIGLLAVGCACGAGGEDGDTPTTDKSVDKKAEGKAAECPNKGQVIIPKGVDPFEITKYDCLEWYPPKGDVSPKVLAAATPEYYGKELTFYGQLKLTDTYNGKYDEAKVTHYAFKVEFEGPDNEYIYIYGTKPKFKKIFTYLADEQHNAVFWKVKVMTDKGHDDDDVFTLLDAAPETEAYVGKCCYPNEP